MSHTDYQSILGDVVDKADVEPTASPRVQAMLTSLLVLVIGKTGNGKSSLCNTLLKRSQFETGCSMSTTTREMQTADTTRDNVKIKVVDTPDVTNLERPKPNMEEEEVSKWKNETLRPPFVVLLAVRCDVRYTAEEYTVYREFLRLWGDNSVKSRLVVAFTFGDRQDGDIGEELKTVCPELQSVLKDAGYRYVVFNNKANTEDNEAAGKKLLLFATSLDSRETDLCAHAIDSRETDLCAHAIFFVLLVLYAFVMAAWIVLEYVPFGPDEWARVPGMTGTALAIMLPLVFWFTIFVSREIDPCAHTIFFVILVLNGFVMAAWIVLTYLPFELYEDARVLGFIGAALAIFMLLGGYLITARKTQWR